MPKDKELRSGLDSKALGCACVCGGAGHICVVIASVCVDVCAIMNASVYGSQGLTCSLFC